VVLLALAGAGGGWYWWRETARPAGPPNSRPVRLTIAPGASVANVGEELEKRGVIRSAWAWGMRARRASTKVALQPGVYDVSASESPARILRRLASGDVARVKATFPEGFTIRQVARRLGARGIVPDESRFLDLVSRRGSTLRASFRPPARLEGYLFPDTYTFPVGASETQIAQQMVGNFDRLVARGTAKARATTRLPLKDVVIIASLIEREAKVDRDRARIAGVIYNRLKKGMPLQIDATVQYARGQHVSRLLFKDLKVDSPYNTYKHKGLPPGPICNPGMASLKAALAPETHPYLFYVARKDGSHVFGRTLAEHNHNIALVRSGRG
jgi:UPF0755 protein